MSQQFYLPDLTGTNPDYRIDGETIVYYARNQVLKFPQPVYFSSIKIHPLNGSANWVAGSDFTYDSIDNTTVSFAKNQDPNFDKIIVDHIILQGDLSHGQYQLTLSYQTYTPTTGDLAINSQDGTVNFTPGVALEILRRLQSQMQKSLLVQSTTVPVDVNPKLLEWDKDGINPNNVISNEMHTINTINGITTIRPTYAPFFADSVTITAGGRTLEEGSDYVFKGLSRSRTAESSNKSGVYNLILFITDYNGDDVSVTYHAVGGKVAMKDMKDLSVGINDIITFLNASQYLTNEQLPDAPNFSALNSRIANLETNMRALLSGSPSYGKTTSGTTVTRQFKANDANLHWYSIATLYKVPGSDDVIKNSDMCFHIEMPERHLQADISIVLDLENAHTPFKVTSENFLYDQGYALFGNTQNVTAPPPLLFRVIYNTDSDNISGCVLQLGTVLPDLLETVAIEDRSSIEGCFQLISNSGNAPLQPSDVGPVTLPDPTRIWNSGATGSNILLKAPNFDDGYLVALGAIPLTSVSTNAVSFNSPYSQNSLLYNWFPIDQFRKIRIYYTVTDVAGNTTEKVTESICQSNTSNNVLSNSATFNSLDLGGGVQGGNLYVSILQNSFTLFYNTIAPTGTTVNINYIQAFV